MTAIPPPLRPWSKTASNKCTSEDIPAYWENNDVITVLADIGMYDIILYNRLDTAEKDHERELKSAYFKKRFVVSRCVLKNILFAVLGMQNTVLIRDTNGRVRLKNRPDIFISLSYSGPYIAVTVGKRKTGSDIEMVRPMPLRKIRSSPLFDGATSGDGKVDNQHLLHVWTLLEAYAKFHDISLYPMIKDRFFSPGTHFVSYLIDQRFILSLASDSDALNDTLLWIDPACRLTPSSAGKKGSCSQPLHHGDTNVRA